MVIGLQSGCRLGCQLLHDANNLTALWWNTEAIIGPSRQKRQTAHSVGIPHLVGVRDGSP